jgi:hypothetical protein
MAVFFDLRSIDEQLTAIEAARAIPESEDAGAAYNKLAGEYQPLSRYTPIMDRQALTLTAEKPWLSKDYPKLAAWLNERKDLIGKLLEISKLEKCRIPIPLDRRQTSHFSNPVRHMSGWAYLLIRSANNDAAEDRIDAAIEKYACILRMSCHLYQQPVLAFYNQGVANESLVLDVLKEFVTKNELKDKQLTAIKAVLLSPENMWTQDSKKAYKIQRLIQRKERPKLTLRDWRTYWEHRRLTNKSDKYLLDVTDKLHVGTLAKRRTVHILIALRQFKNKTGRWPWSLDLIEPQLSEETLTDPRSDVRFLYEVTSDGFRLHSGAER